MQVCPRMGRTGHIGAHLTTCPILLAARPRIPPDRSIWRRNPREAGQIGRVPRKWIEEKSSLQTAREGRTSRPRFPRSGQRRPGSAGDATERGQLVARRDQRRRPREPRPLAGGGLHSPAGRRTLRCGRSNSAENRSRRGGSARLSVQSPGGPLGLPPEPDFRLPLRPRRASTTPQHLHVWSGGRDRNRRREQKRRDLSHGYLAVNRMPSNRHSFDRWYSGQFKRVPDGPTHASDTHG
jgi:hypothetical protein